MTGKNCFVYISVALFFAFNGSRPVFCRIGGSDSGRHKDKKDWKTGKTDIAYKVPVKRIGKAWRDGHCGLE